MPLAVKNWLVLLRHKRIGSICTCFYLIYVRKSCNNFLGFCYVVLPCNFTATMENPSSLPLQLKRQRLFCVLVLGRLAISLISVKDCLIKI